MENNIINIAKRTIRQEAFTIGELVNTVDDEFEKAVALIYQGRGRVIISGIGKSAIVAQKIVASLNSTGTSSVFLHAGDAIHGDIGMVQQDDIVVLISKSGNSPEIKLLAPLIKSFQNTLIAMCGNRQSYLAKCSDVMIDTTVAEEAAHNSLVPTSSTTAQMVMGDALVVCLMDLRGFGAEDFAKFHPGGTLGKKLYLRVKDLSIHNEKPVVNPESLLKDVIIEITKKRLGITVVSEGVSNIEGVITDGDLRRMLEKAPDLSGVKAKDIMTKHPKTIDKNELAVNALEVMRQNNITQLVVLENSRYEGIIHLHDLVREGII